MRRGADPGAPPAVDGATARLKRADLASGVGAGLLGFGLGAGTAETVAGLAPAVLLVGLVLHGWGMVAKRALERDRQAAEPRWSLVLYRGCWLALALLVVVLGRRLLG